MTIAIELSGEGEARLAQQEFLLPSAPSVLSPEGRANKWRAGVIGLPIQPPLSDAAISRDNLYDTRG